MKVEIISNGVGRGTEVYVDGKKLQRVTHLTLDIPAGGVAELTLKTILVNSGDRPFLVDGPEGRELAREVIRFTGEFAHVETTNNLPEGHEWQNLS